MSTSSCGNVGSQPSMLPKPPWLRVKAPGGKVFRDTLQMMRENNLHTVCEEAACPNIGECWNKKHATVMILGATCTRACAFCNVKTGVPDVVNEQEPDKLAETVWKMGLKHVVITSVDRDDLSDGGAQHFINCIKAIRAKSPNTSIEILTPDFLRKGRAGLDVAEHGNPDVYNHNIETVPSLYPRIRPGACYMHSLCLLKSVKDEFPSIFTKSGIMVGLGESLQEIINVMNDMRYAGVDFLTIGQYLRPTPKHAEMVRYVTPKEFEQYKNLALAKGFLVVASGPLVRSSYHADDDFEMLKKPQT